MVDLNGKAGRSGKNDELKIRVGRYIRDQNHSGKKRVASPKTNSYWGKKYKTAFTFGDRLQKVVVEARPFRNSSRQTLLKHFGYISRDGSGKEGHDPQLSLCGKNLEKHIGLQLVKEWSKDRHHFRFIISPENGDKIDLKQLTKLYIQTLENELGTSLQWIASEHYNTEHPHVHLIIRGKRTDGRDLTISGSRFFKTGRLVRIGQEVATKLIGYRTENEIEHSQAKEIEADRITLLDKLIVKKLRTRENYEIDLRKDFDRHSPYEKRTRDRVERRLAVLEKLGLAKKISDNNYRLSPGFDQELKRRGRRNDILSKIFVGRAQSIQNVCSLTLDPGTPERLIGMVRETGIEDELRDKLYVVVEALDGKNYHISLPDNGRNRLAELTEGTLVEVKKESANLQLKPIDRRINEYARTNAGQFNLETYLDYASKQISLPVGVTFEDYLGNFVKRLNVLQNKKIIQRTAPTTWIIPDKFISLVNEFSLERSKQNNFQIDILSRQNPREIAQSRGLTAVDLILAENAEIRQTLQVEGGINQSGVMNLVSDRVSVLSNKFGIQLDATRPWPKQITRELHKESLKTFARENLGGSDILVDIVPGVSFYGDFKGLHDLPSGRHAMVRGEAGTVIVPYVRGMEKIALGEHLKLEISKGRTPESLLERALGQAASFSVLEREKRKEKGAELER